MDLVFIIPFFSSEVPCNREHTETIVGPVVFVEVGEAKA
jgi:hypothetical protein